MMALDAGSGSRGHPTPRMTAHVDDFTSGLADGRQRPKAMTARQLIAFGMEPAALSAQSLSRNKMTNPAGHLPPNQINAETFK